MTEQTYYLFSILSFAIMALKNRKMERMNQMPAIKTQSLVKKYKNLTLIYGFSPNKTYKKVTELSEQFSLHPILEKKAGKLSGGWQRKVSVAMALIGEPQILFLDEPTLGLDVIARQELWNMIRSLKGKITIILTTHYMEEAKALSDRIGIMKNGTLLALGTVEELNRKAQTNDFETAFITLVKETII